jgi:hypothetical protein
VFDERTAVVTELRPLSIHGMGYVDLVAALPEGTTISARLGPEALPEGLQVGEEVVVVSVMATVIEVRRP